MSPDEGHLVHLVSSRLEMPVVDSDINQAFSCGYSVWHFSARQRSRASRALGYPLVPLWARREKRVTGPQWFPGRVFGFREGASPRGTPHRTFASHTHPATMAATVSALRVVAPVARVAARKATAARTALVVKVRAPRIAIARHILDRRREEARAPRSARTSRAAPPLDSRARVPRDAPSRLRAARDRG